MYHIGQRFNVSNVDNSSMFDGEHILAQVGSFKVCLVSLKSGNRFFDPIIVNDPFRIDEDEFSKISAIPCSFVVRLIEETNG